MALHRRLVYNEESASDDRSTVVWADFVVNPNSVDAIMDFLKIDLISILVVKIMNFVPMGIYGAFNYPSEDLVVMFEARRGRFTQNKTNTILSRHFPSVVKFDDSGK